MNISAGTKRLKSMKH